MLFYKTRMTWLHCYYNQHIVLSFKNWYLHPITLTPCFKSSHLTDFFPVSPGLQVIWKVIIWCIWGVTISTTVCLQDASYIEGSSKPCNLLHQVSFQQTYGVELWSEYLCSLPNSHIETLIPRGFQCCEEVWPLGWLGQRYSSHGWVVPLQRDTHELSHPFHGWGTARRPWLCTKKGDFTKTNHVSASLEVSGNWDCEK